MNSGWSLRKPTMKDERAFLAMIDEWTKEGSRINPGIMRIGAEESYVMWYERYLAQLDPATCPEGAVPNQLFFLVAGDGSIHGGCSLRGQVEPLGNHQPSDEMYRIGGHVAYGIRPASRGKGYGTLQLRLLMVYCSKQEPPWRRLLLTCHPDNSASRGVILHCGGEYMDTVLDEQGIERQRYWVYL